MAYAAANIVDFIRGFGQRKEQGRIKDAMTNYMSNPQGTIEAINEINPIIANQMNQDYQDRSAALAAQAQGVKDSEAKRRLTAISGMAQSLGRVRDSGGDIGAAFDQLTPMFKNGFQMDDGEIADWKARVLADPSIIDGLGAEAKKYIVGSPGSGIIDPSTGTIKDIVPNRPQFMQVPNASGGRDVIQVGGGQGAGFAGPQPKGGKLAMTVQGVAPHIVAAESGGDYTAQSPAGALGAYQVMPETARALAGRLGLPWNPGLMTSNTEEGRRYQDQIGGAAIAEAIQASGGDPRMMAAYYHGGSDQSKWGPKTNAYADNVASRIGGSYVPPSVSNGGPQSGAPAPYRGPGAQPIYSTQGKPKKTVRPMTAEEKAAAGLDPNLPYKIDTVSGDYLPVNSTGGAKGKQVVTTPGKLASSAAGSLADSYARMRDQARRLAASPNFNQATGAIQGRIPSVFQGSRDFDTQLQSLRDQVALNATTILKNANTQGSSPLGQVSNADASRLENFSGSLDPTSPTTLRSTLSNIEREGIFGIARTYNIPDGATELLVRDPRLAKDFDAKFGAGLARKILGR